MPIAETSPPFCTAETHLSWLVMVGDRVLKAKKPVRTEFVDLTTRQARQDVAEAEVALNRRLAPDVYLGVATLAGVEGLDEPVVVMRRMPDDRRLALMAARGDDLRVEVHQLAQLLADFHQRVEPVAVGPDGEVPGLQVMRPSLEDVYLGMIGEAPAVEPDAPATTARSRPLEQPDRMEDLR